MEEIEKTKEQLNREKLKQKHICKICQGIYSYFNRTHHIKTKRHQLIANMISQIDSVLDKIDTENI